MGKNYIVSQSNITKAVGNTNTHILLGKIQCFIYFGKQIGNKQWNLEQASSLALQFYFQLSILEEFPKMYTRKHVQEYSL